MDPKCIKLYNKLKEEGLTPEREKKILSELYDEGTHDLPDDAPSYESTNTKNFFHVPYSIYEYHDLNVLQAFTALQSTYNISLKSIDELLERDRQREQDGFPKKINVGRLIKPGKGDKDKIVIVPTTVEEKIGRAHV